MTYARSLKFLLKRGALVAAANWPVVLVQFVADSVFNALLVVPIAGGVLLVMLLVGAEPADLLRLEYREVVRCWPTRSRSPRSSARSAWWPRVDRS